MLISFYTHHENRDQISWFSKSKCNLTHQKFPSYSLCGWCLSSKLSFIRTWLMCVFAHYTLLLSCCGNRVGWLQQITQTTRPKVLQLKIRETFSNPPITFSWLRRHDFWHTSLPWAPADSLFLFPWKSAWPPYQHCLLLVTRVLGHICFLSTGAIYFQLPHTIFYSKTFLMVPGNLLILHNLGSLCESL